VADAVVLDGWAGSDVKLSEVLDALVDMRHSSARETSVARVMTLVVVAQDDDEAYRSTQAMHSLGAHHPARLIVLRTQPDRPASGVDAKVTLYGTELQSRPVSFGEITLSVKGEGCAHLDSIIEPFTLSDLPMVLWYPGALPKISDCLLPEADTVLVDSKETGELGSFDTLVELNQDRVLVDLSWVRLSPWRELLAALFDGPVYRPFARGVTSVEVAGKPGPRHLLGGWLSSRLGLASSAVHLSDARHVSVWLGATYKDQRATFSAVRLDGERAVRAGASIEGGPSHEELLPLPEDSLTWSLGQALTHLRRDPTWRQALLDAVGLIRRTPAQ
jgi:glucose-6-phosphate dehydrogenase assembly protein OpcA